MDLLKQKKDFEWIDNLRVVATICVVFIHVTSSYLKFESQPSSVWWIANIYDSIVRFCVPIFLMITGALLLPKEYQLKDYLKNRILRIIIPFLFWSVIYIIFNYVFLILNGKPISFNFILNDISQKIVSGASFHFWYIYMIIGIYLFIPIIGKWIRNCSENEIKYFLLIWAYITIWNQFATLSSYPLLNLPYFTGYIGYVVLGYYLNIKEFEKVNPFHLLALFILGILITIFGTYYYTVRDNSFNDNFYAFVTPNILISSMGIFLYFKNKTIKNKSLQKIFTFLNNQSFGVYFVHVLVLIFFNKIGITGVKINPIIGFPLLTILCIFISSLIIFILKKLPYGKNFVG